MGCLSFMKRIEPKERYYINASLLSSSVSSSLIIKVIGVSLTSSVKVNRFSGTSQLLFDKCYTGVCRRPTPYRPFCWCQRRPVCPTGGNHNTCVLQGRWQQWCREIIICPLGLWARSDCEEFGEKTDTGGGEASQGSLSVWSYRWVKYTSLLSVLSHTQMHLFLYLESVYLMWMCVYMCRFIHMCVIVWPVCGRVSCKQNF